MKADNTDFAPTFFAWWNRIMSLDDDIGVEEFSRFFTGDAQIVTNEKTVCSGIDAVARHFMAVKASAGYCRVRLPLQKCISSGNDIFVYYLIDAGVQTRRQVIAIMGYICLDEGKAQLCHQLQYATGSGLS